MKKEEKEELPSPSNTNTIPQPFNPNRNEIKMDNTKTKENSNINYKDGNFISKLFFLWIVPLIKIGLKRELNSNDIIDLPFENSTKSLGEILNKNWILQLKGKNPKLCHAVYRTFWRPYLTLACVLLVRDLVCRYGQVIAVYFLLSHFDRLYSGDVGFISGCFVVILIFINSITDQYIYLQAYELGMQIRVSLSTLIYKKVFKLSLGQSNVAEITNLISNDVNRFDRYIYVVGYLFIAPLEFMITFGFLWIYMGLSTIPGLLLTIAPTPLLFLTGTWLAKIRGACAQHTDMRVRHTTELITGIETVKMSTWEDIFLIMIGEPRKQELKELLKRYRISMSNLSASEVVLKFSQFLLLFLYVYFGNTVTAVKVFVVMTLIAYYGSCVSLNFPFTLSGGYEIAASMKRIQHFLMMSEKEVDDTPLDDGSSKDEAGPILTMSNVSASWNPDVQPVLNDISLELKMGELIGVVGPVGSGKSSLLKTILREIPLAGGEVKVHTNKICYVSQDPWIFPATLLENILFGLPYDEIWFKKVVEACGLSYDLQLMSNGVNTFLGDRGATLSGGQKARVNLARAVYANSDIYLLDDPLSAVDVNVAKTIMSDCIQGVGVLKEKGVILVTHQVQYLQETTEIISLKNGGIESRGSFSDVIGTQAEDSVDVVDELEAPPQQTIKSTISNKSEYGTFQPKNPGTGTEEKEAQSSGGVRLMLHWSYWKNGGCFCVFILFCIFLITQGLASASDYWLRIWTEDEEIDQTSKLRNYDMTGALIYLGIVGSFALSAMVRSLLFAKVVNNVSRKLHETVLKRLLRAPMRFFQVNTPGRVLNRFVNDMGMIDEFIAQFYILTIRSFLQLIGLVVVVGTVFPFTLMAASVMFMFYCIFRKLYIRPGSDLKRLESLARSPVFGIANSTFSGIVTIRASKSVDVLLEKFYTLQDAHSAAYICYLGASRWFVLWIEFVTAIYTLVVVCFCLLSGEIHTALIGLAIFSGINVTISSATFGYSLADLENGMISVERIIEYSNLESEAQQIIKDSRPPPDWPTDGGIQFEECSVRYGTNPPVLHAITLSIQSNEKIGIVGRTGAGKSSIISALFRLVELCEGSIKIDTLDISKFGLKDVRCKMSIIPQNPILFIGTLRQNLDPLGQFSDDKLMEVLQDIDFAYRFQGEGELGLDTKIIDNGGNLSHGERQLLCLVRAMLENTKILILDEATAHVDTKTDARIQDTLRSKFMNRSVITVAHRLSTVMDNDKILVLGEGKILEFDHPYILLQNQNGNLYQLTQKAGPKLREEFLKTALSSYEKNKK